jgi:hypothetical protein
MESRVHARQWIGAAAVATGVLPASLFLRWFSGYEDSGPYSASGWSAFNYWDIALTLAAFAAFLAIAAIVVWPRHAESLALVPGLVGVTVFALALFRGLLGHADEDPALRTPEVGVYVAMAAAAILSVAAAVLRGTQQSEARAIHRPTS